MYTPRGLPENPLLQRRILSPESPKLATPSLGSLGSTRATRHVEEPKIPDCLAALSDYDSGAVLDCQQCLILHIVCRFSGCRHELIGEGLGVYAPSVAAAHAVSNSCSTAIGAYE